MKIIALTGRARVGKSTFAQKFQDSVGPNRVFITAFNDPLKIIASRNFGYKGTKSCKDRQILQDVLQMFLSADPTFFDEPVVSEIYAAEKLDYDFFVITDLQFPMQYYLLRGLIKKNPALQVRLIRLERSDVVDECENSSVEYSTKINSRLLPVDATIKLENNPDYNIDNYIKFIW